MAFRSNSDSFCPSDSGQFSRRLDNVYMALGFGAGAFRSHSLRRGGATAQAVVGVSNLDIMNAGRWVSEQFCRLYIIERSGGATASREVV